MSAEASTARFLLYYAGMADDKETEQIGLAVSEDGFTFERESPDGLIVPRDPAVAWKSLRVCNPTVLRLAGGYEMFYQGIAAGSLNVSIGRAVSGDGRNWTCDPEPCLPWQLLAGAGEGLDQRAGGIEPAVLVEDGRYRMWFVQLHPAQEGNGLLYAESADGREWSVRPEPLLSGRSFGEFLFHYPQVRRTNDSYELLFTLRSLRTGVDGIYRMISPDGLAWSGLQRVQGRWEPRLVSSNRGPAGKIARRLYRAASRGANALGYSHPHVVDVDGKAWLYYHNDNLDPRGRRLDISVRELASGRNGPARKILEPAPERAVWDSFFVADPFVVVRP